MNDSRIDGFGGMVCSIRIHTMRRGGGQEVSGPDLCRYRKHIQPKGLKVESHTG